MAAISAARKAAFGVLMAVERGHSHSDELLRGRTVNALSSPDRNLATALVLGVLRWQISLDHQLRALLKRPNAKLDAEILIALRLGAFQLLHLDRIPARAAIDESVELAKQNGHRFGAGMVNAVLRKLAVAPKPAQRILPVEGTGLAGQDLGPGVKSTGLAGHGLGPGVKGTGLVGQGFSPDAKPENTGGALAPEGCISDESGADLALAYAHPLWIVERWVSFFGLEAARAICRHGQSQPVLTVRIESPAVELELTKSGVYLEPGDLLTSARAVISGDLTAAPAFKEGRVRLQDEGSQLVAEIAGQGCDLLDCCAAPGGKTLILAERNPQARILACESSSTRQKELSKRLAAYADRIECRLADAAALVQNAAFDLALADVPCSGTGTLGRNPEIRHRLRPEDFARQAERQSAILRAALRAVRPGGRVVYSTCSLDPEENEQVVASVLAEVPNARPVPLDARVAALLSEGILTPSGAERLGACLTPEGALRLLPGAFHTDGFFIAMIERIA
jgi:16S rRNA (cytosine967-C5)-methyltransferase